MILANSPESVVCNLGTKAKDLILPAEGFEVGMFGVSKTGLREQGDAKTDLTFQDRLLSRQGLL